MEHKPQKLGFLDIIWHYKYQLSVNIFVVSFSTFSLLYYFNIVPNELRVLDSKDTSPIQTVQAQTMVKATSTPVAIENAQDLPRKIIIAKIGVNTTVTNPTSTNNATLNEYLLRGAVRYPGSGTLGQGNLFIFGHSSGLKIVNNQAFKAFNNLKNLKADDEIRVQSSSREYVYKVTAVRLADSDQVLVDFTSKKNMLTLSTCNVFGEKQERYVVEASFISSKKI